MAGYSSVLPMTGEVTLVIESVRPCKLRFDDEDPAKCSNSYMIEAHEPGRLELHWQLETMSPLRASLCERHVQDGKPLRVTWRRSAYGKDLDEVWEL